ncbi:hypothetical protein L1987_74488 [Smallanthus sonchifolius]|uniref:Uncharacterized protein n=1 Tax=Smallanthus sonchifolius TaxID=185202 RepID=A0ACB9A233_9ASTR|nr:hypothetical protein L1987_74488 [Smallanthus sonchifolius]
MGWHHRPTARHLSPPPPLPPTQLPLPSPPTCPPLVAIIATATTPLTIHYRPATPPPLPPTSQPLVVASTATIITAFSSTISAITTPTQPRSLDLHRLHLDSLVDFQVLFDLSMCVHRNYEQAVDFANDSFL